MQVKDNETVGVWWRGVVRVVLGGWRPRWGCWVIGEQDRNIHYKGYNVRLLQVWSGELNAVYIFPCLQDNSNNLGSNSSFDK